MKFYKRLQDSLDLLVGQIMKVSANMPEKGLLSGKTGIVILLYEYARYKNDPAINDFANRLVTMIVHETRLDSEISLNHGLCGIVWGFNYLLTQDFVKAGEDFFEEFDAVLFREMNKSLNLCDFIDETDKVFLAWSRFNTCPSSVKSIWLQRIGDYLSHFCDVLAQKNTSLVLPFPCRTLVRFFQLAKILDDHRMYKQEINSLYGQLPELVKLSLHNEQCFSDKYMLVSLLADIPLFEKCTKDNIVTQTMTMTDAINFYTTRLLLGKTVSIPAFAEKIILSIAEDIQKTDALLYQLNPQHAGLGCTTCGLAWSLLQWSIANNLQPLNANQSSTTVKRPYAEMRKSHTLDFIPLLKPLESVNSPRYIVSLTSYGKRLVALAPYAILTLLNQSAKPDKVVLWVAHEDKGKIPQVLYDLTSKGLEIHFCEDIKSFKKLIFSIEMYPDDYIITVDDDVYYPQNWFAQLLSAHKKNPKKIICHRAHGIKVDEQYNPIPYLKWYRNIEPGTYFSSMSDERHFPESIFPIGMCGILYPPGCFHRDISNQSLYMRLAPKADDIWFWAMAVLNQEYYNGESPYIVVEKGYSTYLHEIDPELQRGENALWSYNSQGGNDLQLKAVIEHYPQIREYLRKIVPTKMVVITSENCNSVISKT